MISPVDAVSLLALTTLGVVASGISPKGKTDRDMQDVLDALSELGGKPIETLSPVEAREQPTPADAVAALLIANRQGSEPEKVNAVEDRAIKGPAGNISIRIYTPEGTGPFPVIVYYHGGGFVIADLDVYDSTPRALANATGAIVVSSHYRQGPEHKFPAAHEDALAAYQWVFEHADEFKGDADRMAVAGESAGASLAAAVCIMARERHMPLPAHQLLVYPVTDSNTETPSYRENAEAKPLNRAMMEWFFKHAAKPEDINDPRLGLLKVANLAGLPSATVITAEIDPLRSEGEALAAKFKTAGVDVHYRNYDGVTHEFFGMGAVVKKAGDAVAFAASQLKTALHSGKV